MDPDEYRREAARTRYGYLHVWHEDRAGCGRADRGVSDRPVGRARFFYRAGALLVVLVDSWGFFCPAGGGNPSPRRIGCQERDAVYRSAEIAGHLGDSD